MHTRFSFFFIFSFFALTKQHFLEVYGNSDRDNDDGNGSKNNTSTNYSSHHYCHDNEGRVIRAQTMTLYGFYIIILFFAD